MIFWDKYYIITGKIFQAGAVPTWMTDRLRLDESEKYRKKGCRNFITTHPSLNVNP